MASPLVSVHVVTYNQRALIAETIESALAQDYEPLEIVVADDGSTDGTDAIVRGYAERFPDRVVALTGAPNLGISGNSNRCLQRCRGEYVAFLAGDDLMQPGKVGAQVAWFEERSERVLCAHDVEHFDSDTGARIKLHSSMARLRSGAGVRAFLDQGYFSATSSLMVRASAMPPRGFDDRIRIHSDFKFAVECLVNGGEFGFVPGVLGRYRRHAKNATSRHSALLWEELHVGFAILEADYPEHVAAWAHARAHCYYQRAVALVLRGDGGGARRAIRNAVRHDPLVSAKLPVWWAVSYLPSWALPARLRDLSSASGEQVPP